MISSASPSTSPSAKPSSASLISPAPSCGRVPKAVYGTMLSLICWMLAGEPGAKKRMGMGNRFKTKFRNFENYPVALTRLFDC